MARITVEDCVTKVADRFELVIVGSARAKELVKGSPALVERNNDKPTVIALREISEDKLNIPQLRESVIRGFRSTVPAVDADETSAELQFIEREILGDIRADDNSMADMEKVEGKDLDSLS